MRQRRPTLLGDRRSGVRLSVTEDMHQQAIIEWARYRTVDVTDVRGFTRRSPLLDHLYAVPNGHVLHSAGFTPGQMAARMRRLIALGLQPGALDLNLDVARGLYHGMRLELKSATGRVSTEQAIWIDRHIRAGYHAVLARGAERAIARFDEYLALRPGQFLSDSDAG